jgi:hypothetical protein
MALRARVIICGLAWHAVKHVNSRFPDDLYEAIAAAADAEERPVGSWHRIAAKEKLARDGNVIYNAGGGEEVEFKPGPSHGFPIIATSDGIREDTAYVVSAVQDPRDPAKKKLDAVKITGLGKGSKCKHPITRRHLLAGGFGDWPRMGGVHRSAHLLRHHGVRYQGSGGDRDRGEDAARQHAPLAPTIRQHPGDECFIRHWSGHRRSRAACVVACARPDLNFASHRVKVSCAR